jgi:excisionase family DNA binding protein
MNNLLTVKDVASVLQVDTNTVRRYLNDGLLKGVKLSGSKKKGRWRITEEDLQQFVNKEKINA